MYTAFNKINKVLKTIYVMPIVILWVLYFSSKLLFDTKFKQSAIEAYSNGLENAINFIKEVKCPFLIAHEKHLHFFWAVLMILISINVFSQ